MAKMDLFSNKLFIKDLTKANSALVTILDHTDSDTHVLDNIGSKLLLVTNLNAPNKRVVTVDASNPSSENWVNIIPETKNVLSVFTGGGYIFAKYMVDAISKVKQFDKSGKKYVKLNCQVSVLLEALAVKIMMPFYITHSLTIKYPVQLSLLMQQKVKVKYTVNLALNLIVSNTNLSKYFINLKMVQKYR